MLVTGIDAIDIGMRAASIGQALLAAEKYGGRSELNLNALVLERGE